MDMDYHKGISVGDFIRIRGDIGRCIRSPRGFVVGEGVMGKNIPVWKIRQGNGSITLIAKDEAITV